MSTTQEIYRNPAAPIPLLFPSKDSHFPQWRASPEDNSYPRGCPNSQWPSVSFIGAKTQQIINYSFSQMVSHIPHRHACALGRKLISQQQKVACASGLHALLSDLGLFMKHWGLEAGGNAQLKWSYVWNREGVKTGFGACKNWTAQGRGKIK